MGVRNSIEGRSPLAVNASFVAVASRTGMDALVYAVDKEGYPRLAELKVMFWFYLGSWNWDIFPSYTVEEC